MNTLPEIESAIELLPPSQVEELAVWLEAFRRKQGVEPAVERWLQQARGAARSGETTASIMATTRGEE